MQRQLIIQRVESMQRSRMQRAGQFLENGRLLWVFRRRCDPGAARNNTTRNTCNYNRSTLFVLVAKLRNGFVKCTGAAGTTKNESKNERLVLGDIDRGDPRLVLLTRCSLFVQKTESMTTMHTLGGAQANTELKGWAWTICSTGVVIQC